MHLDFNSPCAADEAASFLGSNGALSIVKSTPDSLEDSDILTYKSNILKKLDEKNIAVSSNWSILDRKEEVKNHKV